LGTRGVQPVTRVRPVAGQWPLTGRDEELAAMLAAVDDPDGGGIVVAGPQGVGRSRLAHEVERRLAGAGRCTARATASHAAATIGFGALAPLLPDHLAPLVDRPTELLRRAGEVIAALTGTTGTAGAGAAAVLPVLVVDDAHLLDDVSAAFLHQVALRRLATLVVTVRTHEPIPGRPPDAVTALWKDGLLTRCDVGPLSRAATAGLLERVLDGHLDLPSLRRIQRTAAGNPLFLREIVHAALEDGSMARHRGLWQWDGVRSVSDRLVELVRTRLDAADPRSEPALELVAWGEPLPVWLAERVLGDGAGGASLEAAERAGLLDRIRPPDSRRPGPDDGSVDEVLRFAHPVHGVVLRSTTPVGRRRTVCGQLAEALLAWTGDGPARLRPALLRIAVWLLEADAPPDRRPVSFAVAARLALEDDDPRLAERLARAVLDTGDDEHADERSAARAVLADALEKQGRHDEVVRLRHARPFGDGGSVGVAVAALGGEVSGSDPIVDPSRGEVPATDAWVLLFDSRLAESIGIAQVVLSRTDATPRAHVWAATAGASALGLSGRTAEALAAADVGLVAARSLGAQQPWSAPEVLWARVIALVVAGRIEEARTLVDPGFVEPGGDASSDLTDPADLPSLAGMWRGFRGLVSRLQGDHATARTNLREAVALFDLAGPDQTGLPTGVVGHFVRLWLAELAATLASSGDPGGARQVFDEAVERDTGTNRVFEPWIALDGAWVCAGESRLTEAVDVALRAADMALTLGHRAFEVNAVFDVARLGRPDLVEERLTGLVPLVEGRFAPACRDATRALLEGDPGGLADCSRRFEALGHDLVAAEMAAAALALLPSDAEAVQRARRLRSRCPEALTPLLPPGGDQANPAGPASPTSPPRPAGPMPGGGSAPRQYRREAGTTRGTWRIER
jgi:hypothetical protein